MLMYLAFEVFCPCGMFTLFDTKLKDMEMQFGKYDVIYRVILTSFVYYSKCIAAKCRR